MRSVLPRRRTVSRRAGETQRANTLGARARRAYVLAVCASLATIVACATLARAAQPAVPAEPPTPLPAPPGLIFTGVSSGSFQTFEAQTGKHPAIYGEFVTWGESIHFAFAAAAAAHARLMLHISTAPGYHVRPAITPRGIARGNGDAYLVNLNQLVSSYGAPVYIRLMPEMNQSNTPYCAFNHNGSSRGPQYATSAFIAAWRRSVIVLRGGPVARINDQLHALGLPALQGVAAGGSLPVPPVSFVWTPQVAGDPDIAANSASAYYPGNQYVDWVGTDFYSKFPNFADLDAFYAEYPQKPFAFTEWAVWGGDNTAYVKEFFDWVESNPRVGMIVYNQGYGSKSPFSLARAPHARALIRADMRSSTFVAYDQVASRYEIAAPVSGIVRVRLPGTHRFVNLASQRVTPDGSEFDVTFGRVRLVVAGTPGVTHAVELYGGRFIVHESVAQNPVTTFALSLPLDGCKPEIRAATAKPSKGRPRSRHVWVTENGGKFNTKGHYVSTSVEGTSWVTSDTCTSSMVAVAQGVVAVHDLLHHRTIVLHAGHSYTVYAHS